MIGDVLLVRPRVLRLVPKGRTVVAGSSSNDCLLLVAYINLLRCHSSALITTHFGLFKGTVME